MTFTYFMCMEMERGFGFWGLTMRERVLGPRVPLSCVLSVSEDREKAREREEKRERDIEGERELELSFGKSGTENGLST